MAEQISASEFNQKVLGADKPVLVDFFATWCGPCKMLSPTVEEIAEESDGSFSVFKVDIDEGEDIAMDFAIMSVPTLIIFKDGLVNSIQYSLAQ